MTLNDKIKFSHRAQQVSCQFGQKKIIKVLFSFKLSLFANLSNCVLRSKSYNSNQDFRFQWQSFFISSSSTTQGLTTAMETKSILTVSTYVPLCKPVIPCAGQRVGRRQARAQVAAGSSTGPLRGYVTQRSLRARRLRQSRPFYPVVLIAPC